MLGLDTNHSLVLGYQPGNRHTFDHPGATVLRSLDQSHGRVDRRRHSVAGDVQRSDQIIGVQERKQFLGPIHIDDFGLDIEAGSHRRPAHDLFPAFLIGGHRDRPRRSVAGRLPGLVLELLEESRGIGGQLRQAVRRLEL